VQEVHWCVISPNCRSK